MLLLEINNFIDQDVLFEMVKTIFQFSIWNSSEERRKINGLNVDLKSERL